MMRTIVFSFFTTSTHWTQLDVSLEYQPVLLLGIQDYKVQHAVELELEQK